VEENRLSDAIRQKAEKAKQLLEDPMLKGAFDEAEKALNQAVRMAKTEAEAFKAAIACQVFDLIRSRIEAHVENQKVVEFNFKPSLRERIGL
jgi:hypothetical protein